MVRYSSSLLTVLCKAVEGKSFEKNDILYLLNLKEDAEIELLHRVARLVRGKYFGNKVFLYGFIYFSTHCKNDCNFCHYRKSNTGLSRFRKNEFEVLEAAGQLAKSGVHLIDLTMGEDPTMFHPDFGLKRMLQLIRKVKAETGLPVMLSPGAISNGALSQVGAAGTDWFACYQETHSSDLFSRLRHDQSYDDRMNTKMQAKDSGMLIEEGILTGVGETTSDIADSILAMQQMQADQVRVMTFVPQPDTPMASCPPGGSIMEEVIISVMRLVMPRALIPASLDIDGLRGLSSRLHAGANVVTSIIPPGQGLAGVANASLDIEESRRSVESIRSVLATCGMETASVKDYKDWIESRRLFAANRVEQEKAVVNCRYWTR